MVFWERVNAFGTVAFYTYFKPADRIWSIG